MYVVPHEHQRYTADTVAEYDEHDELASPWFWVQKYTKLKVKQLECR